MILITACFKENKEKTIINMIPIPTEQVITKGVFVLSSATKLT